MNESWRKKNPFGRLREYELKHFVLDLEERGPMDKLHRVFLLEDSDGRNAWYEAKTAIGAGAAYISDLERAWGVLKKENQRRVAGDEPPDLTTEFRYALTTAVLGSGPSRPPWLVVELARHGVWTPEEAVTFALRDGEWSHRAVALTELGGLLDGDWRLAAQKAALSTIGEGHNEAPNRTAVMSDPTDREATTADRRRAAECVGMLVPALADALIPSALETAKKVGGLWHFHAMKAVLPRLAEVQRETEVESLWQWAGEYRASYWRAEAMAVVAPLSSAERRDARMVEAARMAVDVLGDEQARFYRLQEPLTGALLIGSSALLVRREDLRALNEIAPHISLEQWKDAEGRVMALPEEMRAAAQSVLLPQLARLGAGSESLAAIDGMKSGYFRGLARAAVLEHGAGRPDALMRWISEADSLEDVEERALCRAALARAASVRKRAAMIASVLGDVRKTASEMRLPALLDLAPAFRNLSARERVPLVNEALELAAKGSENTAVVGEFVSCALGAHLDRKAVVERHQSERGVEVGHSGEGIGGKMRSAVGVKPIEVGVGRAGGLPVARVAEALQRITTLPAIPHSRAITLAAQFAGEGELEVLAEAASGIRNEYARSFALYALMQRAGEAQRPRFAIELLRTLLSVTGGLSGAEPFFQAVAGALGRMKRETYEECNKFAASLAQESIGTALKELTPAAAVLQGLSGPAVLDEIAEAVGLIDRWWGKRGPAEQEERADKTEWRFQWQALPTTDQEIALELLTILTKGREFEAAGEVLEEIRAMGWAPTAEAGLDVLVGECAAAGELDRCAGLLKQAKSLSGNTAGNVARAYIQYGRLGDAFALLSVRNAWPVAFQIIESLGAEERWRDALTLFEKMVSAPVPAEACEDFVNSCFVVGNGAFKTRDALLQDGFLTAMRGTSFAEGVGGEVCDRLNEYADDLARRGHTARAEVWRKLVGMIG